MSDDLDDAFDALVAALGEAAASVRAHPFFADDENRVSAYRFVLSMLIARLEEDVIFDPDFPSLRSVDTRIREAGDNPDQRYWTTRIRGGETYRVWGRRGTARRVDVQVYAGLPAQAGSGRSVGFLAFEDLQIDADGSFEVIVSPDRRAGNWIDCPTDASRLFVRQVFSDWDNELPGEVHIDRVGSEGEPKPSVTDADMAERLRAASAHLVARVDFWPEMVRQQYLEIGPNQLSPLYDPGALGGVHGRLMSHGTFDLADDEALVVRLWPGSGNYLGIQLGDLWFSSLEYANRQTSLSTDQAVPATDGSYRFVICGTDPGLPNWLDTTGLRRGYILIRYDGENGVIPDDAHQPTTQVVPVQLLRSVLPDDSPTVGVEARRRALAARRRHVQRRFGT
ncbi:MAG: DUF1214 domain-containing protein [Acidimicrobiales bacterium]|nr:DUF1214 domain-containing protein [Acidimicrobiales bacterium]